MSCSASKNSLLSFSWCSHRSHLGDMMCDYSFPAKKVYHQSQNLELQYIFCLQYRFDSTKSLFSRELSCIERPRALEVELVKSILHNLKRGIPGYREWSHEVAAAPLPPGIVACRTSMISWNVMNFCDATNDMYCQVRGTNRFQTSLKRNIFTCGLH